MSDEMYIKQVREQLELTEMCSGKIPQNTITNSCILYRKYLGETVNQCVIELLR